MDIGSLNRIAGGTMWDTLPNSHPDREQTAEVAKAVRALNDSQSFGSGRELTFRWDTEANRPIARIVQRETGEVIQEIPSPQILRMMAALRKNQRKVGT